MSAYVFSSVPLCKRAIHLWIRDHSPSFQPTRSETSSSGTVQFSPQAQPEPLPRQKKAKRKLTGMPARESVSEQQSGPPHGETNDSAATAKKEGVTEATEMPESPTAEEASRRWRNLLVFRFNGGRPGSSDVANRRTNMEGTVHPRKDFCKGGGVGLPRTNWDSRFSTGTVSMYSKRTTGDSSSSGGVDGADKGDHGGKAVPVERGRKPRAEAGSASR
ncbi:hypothetical protein DFH06DRAFT_1121720 [Mycena polygramma]|nr:hypothetical protein DFH06DRAFT_1121720 [Mycena polygramma]